MNSDAQQFAAWHALVADQEGTHLPTPIAVARRARQLWEESNRPNDRDEEIWAEAERQLVLGAAENNLQP